MASERLTRLVADAVGRFEDSYQSRPDWVVAAPGRANLIGEHVDYNDGLVLPMAIDRYCVIAAAEQPTDGRGRTATIRSLANDDQVDITLDQPERGEHGHWWNYVAGVLAGCQEAGMQPPSFRGLTASDVPIGGGLSSSASLEVATATLLEAMTSVRLDPAVKARLCQQAEHDYAGVPCGIMDQFASVMGQADHLMLLDCRTQQIEQIPFVDPAITVLVVNTNVKHELAGSEYAARRAACSSSAKKLRVDSLRDATDAMLDDARDRLDPVEFCRARHVIGEIRRTAEAAAAVRVRDWPRVGELMYASHDSLRDDFEVSCPELDLLVDLARSVGPAGGVFGSRMTGGGFGGCTVSLVETSKVEHVERQLTDAYVRTTGIEPRSLTSRPARGAHIVTNREPSGRITIQRGGP